MLKLFRFLSTQHLFANVTMIIVILGGVLFWKITPKQEMPDFTFDFITVRASLPGASAVEVEYFVTQPIETELKTVAGVGRIISQSSPGTTSINVEVEKGSLNDGAFMSEFRDAVFAADLPDEVEEQPEIRIRKTSRKAVIDIAIFNDVQASLDSAQRSNLQAAALTLENRLLNLPTVGGVERDGYLKPEVRIELDPFRLVEYELPVSKLISGIRSANVRLPAGELDNLEQNQITVDSELRTRADLANIIVQGGFEGYFTHLRDVGRITSDFEESKSLLRVNGRDAVVLSVIKKSSVGILEAVDDIKAALDKFRAGLKPNTTLKVIYLDDESRDVRNRISIITQNGIIGLILILIVLFAFMSLRSGLWVAAGIPFTFSLTLILASLFGYSINNMTLAAVIIAMGMLVDDAIVVSENISRLAEQGVDNLEASARGTAEVFWSITVSILTTCAAFLPLLFFEGRVSLLSNVIPPIVSLMLLASLIESVLLLPAHLSSKPSRWVRAVLSLGLTELFARARRLGRKTSEQYEGTTDKEHGHWFYAVEGRFAEFLEMVLNHRWAVLLGFAVFTVVGGLVFTEFMRFSLFPRQPPDRIWITAEAPPGTKLATTAELETQIADIIRPHLGTDLLGFRTRIGGSRWRGVSSENSMAVRVELLPDGSGGRSARELKGLWEPKLKNLKGLAQFKFGHHRFGSDSGSAIEVVVQHNNDQIRNQVSQQLVTLLGDTDGIGQVEIDKRNTAVEYRLKPRVTILRKLGVNANQLAMAVRTAVNGTTLYQFREEDNEEVNVRLLLSKGARSDLEQLLAIPVANEAGFLVPLGQLVSVIPTPGQDEIRRQSGRRTTMVYADLASGTSLTVLQAARLLETSIFPKLEQQFPGVSFDFEGEIKFTRESTGFLPMAIASVLVIIYFMLTLKFSSLSQPLFILAGVAPAFASTVFVFIFHGMTTYGFFAAVGGLGLSGVLVNDGIILLQKLNESRATFLTGPYLYKSIAQVASTRLRAVVLTTITTAAGLIPTAYGFAGYDAMLAEMMLALAWGLIFGTAITLIMLPCLYVISLQLSQGWLDVKPIESVLQRAGK